MAESITEGTLKQFSKRMQLAHSFFAIFPKNQNTLTLTYA